MQDVSLQDILSGEKQFLLAANRQVVHRQQNLPNFMALEEKLPGKYWVEINGVLVPFGKQICTGNYPRCSTCTLNDMCQQIGVEKSR